jgi:hypothetical protein
MKDRIGMKNRMEYQLEGVFETMSYKKKDR